MAHVSKAKKQEVMKIKELIIKYPSIGIINLTDLPSPQFQSLRSKLKISNS